jgi:hypothetical protein
LESSYKSAGDPGKSGFMDNGYQAKRILSMLADSTEHQACLFNVMQDDKDECQKINDSYHRYEACFDY